MQLYNEKGLGHVRLSINDLSPAGAQPFHNGPPSTIHAVINGELYDHDRIRDELMRTTKFTFHSTSDCEIVIALYERYGLSFLEHLRGEFALCLYDAETQVFVAARDRYGIKPLFWTMQAGRLLVAAEAKAFLPLGWQPEWDVKSLAEGGWNNDERTIFRDVQKRLKDIRTEAEMIENVRKHLLESVRLRLRADVPVGVYLSGGIDSSVIAGMVTHLVREQGEKIGNDRETERVSCFSIAFDEDSGFDESPIANRTADFLGVKYFKKHMNEAELAKRFEDATWHCEHYNPDLNFVGKFALSELPREHGFKVVLTGEGADEHFSGYQVYLPDYLREPDTSFQPPLFPESLRIEQFERAERDLADYYSSIGAYMSTSSDTLPRRMLNSISTPASMAAFRIDSLFASWTKKEYGVPEPELTIANNVDGRVRSLMTDKWHPLHSAQYVWTKGHLANIFLSCLGDRTEMAHSIEARTPFLDHKLTEYVNGLPPSVKMRWVAASDGQTPTESAQKGAFVEKWILREAAKPFITDELYKRRKHPYSAPTTYPENGPLNELLQHLITKENVEELGFVDWDITRDLVYRAFVGKEALAMRFAFSVAQWVVLSQRFGIKRAEMGSAFL
ncbi:MAG: hypothetical protein Q9165_004152 [Trypethelium subeluteriae]